MTWMERNRLHGIYPISGKHCVSFCKNVILGEWVLYKSLRTSKAWKRVKRKIELSENATAIPNGNGRPFLSLGIKNFRFLLTGTILSNAAQWIQQVTLSWLVYHLTGSGTLLGSINFVRSLASFGMIPAAGLLVDRMQRRKLMLLTNGWLFIITFCLGMILILGYSRVSYLFIYAFLGGMTQTIDMSLRQVVVFDLVPRWMTPNAVAIIQTGWSLMRSFGPGIGGLLILWFGPGGNFLIQACAYCLINITITRIQFPVRHIESTRNSALENIREGMQYIIKERITMTFMFIGFLLPIFIIPIFSILPAIYAADVFKGGADVLGYLMSSVGVGGIAGGVVTASLGRVERRGILQLAALFMVSLMLIVFAFCETLWIALLMLAVAGFFEMIFLTTNQTLLQLSIPDEIRGRITSIINLNAVLFPLGGMVAGMGSDYFHGPKVITVIMAGTAAVISLLILLFSPIVRQYRLSEAISRNPLTSFGNEGD